MPPETKASRKRELVAWMLHLTVYSVLLLTYFWFVLRYLADWFLKLFQHHRFEYALFGILIMIVQAVLLESVSAFILGLFRRARS
jgi:hypothetical protein